MVGSKFPGARVCERRGGTLFSPTRIPYHGVPCRGTTHADHPSAPPPHPAPQGVRFKRVIMDESSTDRSFDPPKQEGFKRMVFCSGKVRFGCVPGLVDRIRGRAHALTRTRTQPPPMPFLTPPHPTPPPTPPSRHPSPLSRRQLYYELAAERAKQGKQGEVALIRVEQMAPFPFDLVMREMRRFPNAGGWRA